VLILQVDKVLCFDALLEVLILKVVSFALKLCNQREQGRQKEKAAAKLPLSTVLPEINCITELEEVKGNLSGLFAAA
jgi:hypothetical protein